MSIAVTGTGCLPLCAVHAPICLSVAGDTSPGYTRRSPTLRLFFLFAAFEFHVIYSTLISGVHSTALRVDDISMNMCNSMAHHWHTSAHPSSLSHDLYILVRILEYFLKSDGL